jgi:hypothetical protein
VVVAKLHKRDDHEIIESWYKILYDRNRYYKMEPCQNPSSSKDLL